MIGFAISVVGLSSPIAFAVLLDRIVKPPIKTSLAQKIYGGKDATLKTRLSAIYDFIASAIFDPHFRLYRIFIFCAVSISFTVSLQYIYNRASFNNTTLPFFRSMNSHPLYSVLIISSFIFIEFTSLYQSFIFLRIARYIQNGLELFFISVADILLSFLLVILLLPFLMIVIVYATFDRSERNLYVALDNVSHQQAVSLADIVRMTMPAPPDLEQPTNEPSKDDRVATLLETKKWTYVRSSVYVGPTTIDISLDSDFTRSLFYAGNFLYLESATESVDVIASRLSSIFNISGNVLSSSVVFSDRSIFGREIFLLELVVKPKIPLSYFLTSYFRGISDVNFFGPDMELVYKLGSKSISPNDILWNAASQRAILEVFTDIYLSCNQGNSVEILPTSGESTIEAITNCEDGVIIPEPSLAANGSRFTYTYKSAPEVPILPLAVSSIIMTILVYIFCGIWSMLPSLNKFSDKFVAEGSKFIEKNVFSVTFSALVIFTLMLYSLFSFAY